MGGGKHVKQAYNNADDRGRVFGLDRALNEDIYDELVKIRELLEKMSKKS